LLLLKDRLSTRELLGRIWSSKIIIVCSVKMVKMKRWRICSCTAPLQRVVGLLLGNNSSGATRSCHNTRIL
jgi:hypothetical protein